MQVVKFATSAARLKRRSAKADVTGTSKHCQAMTLSQARQLHLIQHPSLQHSCIHWDRGEIEMESTSDFTVSSPAGAGAERTHNLIGTLFGSPHHRYRPPIYQYEAD